jgi:hypothetical protein
MLNSPAGHDLHMVSGGRRCPFAGLTSISAESAAPANSQQRVALPRAGRASNRAGRTWDTSGMGTSNLDLVRSAYLDWGRAAAEQLVHERG